MTENKIKIYHFISDNNNIKENYSFTFNWLKDVDTQIWCQLKLIK